MPDKHDEWIGLSEAAQILGVHPSTLRAWADKGELPSRRTAGGHRRFKRSDLQPAQSGSASQPAETELMVHSALGRTRMQIGEGQLDELDWYQQFNDRARQEQRTMGRELLTQLTHYLTVPEDRTAALSKAQHIGQRYGDMAYEQGLSLGDSVRAFFFFRDLLNDSVIQLADTLSLPTAHEWGEKLREVSHFSDTILLALIERYQDMDAT